MQAKAVKRVFIFVLAVFTMGLIVGCSGLEKAPNREGYVMYHKPLPEADRALEQARMAGKDRECPAEFNAAKEMVDKAYETYMACRNQEAMDMAKEAIKKINALCPPKPVVEMRPEPKPTPPPVVAPPPQAVSPPPPPPVVAPPPPPPVVAPPPPPPVVAPVRIMLEDIHFDFDLAVLTKDALDILNRNINTLKANQGVRVEIEGHTCAHGAEDYNMALGERRALAVKEYLATQGIAASRMTTITYGETRLALPETPTPKNKNDKEAKENRRVHFEVITK